MVVAEEEEMNKSTLKVSVSDSDSSSDVESENEEEMEEAGADRDAESVTSNDEKSSHGPSDESNSGGSNDESDSDVSNDESSSDGGLLVTNEGWADSVAKILDSSKPKNKKTLVLSRAKKHSEIVIKVKEEKPAFEVIGESESKEVKPDVKKEEPSSEPVAKKKKQEKPSIRVKPNVLEKDRERLLTKIATKGVVQLFNAVRNQQKTLEKEIGRNDLSESKKEKILKKFDKRAFLDTLMGQSKSILVDEAKNLKSEVKAKDQPKWSALRDDFMMGAKMKDWDKESVDE